MSVCDRVSKHVTRYDTTIASVDGFLDLAAARCWLKSFYQTSMGV